MLYKSKNNYKTNYPNYGSTRKLLRYYHTSVIQTPMAYATCIKWAGRVGLLLNKILIFKFVIIVEVAPLGVWTQIERSGPYSAIKQSYKTQIKILNNAGSPVWNSVHYNKFGEHWTVALRTRLAINLLNQTQLNIGGTTPMRTRTQI